MLHITAATFALTWKIYFYSWLKRWDDQKRGIEALGVWFKPLQVEPTCTLNIVTYNACVLVLLRVVGFSAKFQSWALYWYILPSLAGSWLFLQNTYGKRMWAVTPALAINWLCNWFAMFGIGLASLSISMIIYVLGLVLEPMLPKALHYTFSFPLELMELSLQHAVYFMGGMLIFLLLTLPVWAEGYRLNMEVVGRKSNLSYAELALEIVYQASHGCAALFFSAPCAMLYETCGVPLHVIHYLAFGLELVFINSVTQYKFCVLHQLMHDIRPLYHMAHIEHHICKTIHPVSSAVGLWETMVEGGGPFLGGVGLSNIPYFFLQVIYTGANVVVHTMWPAKCLVQWHTLHHVVLADIFNVNIPSPRDEESSKYFARYNQTLEEMSVFVRLKWLSDVTAFAFVLAAGAFAHYVLGGGVVHAWGNAIWTPTI
mmetsp:Transcript_22258/g.29660  ORF Transcript_22258/g.29660 Transcript_22258/m.29660 type:complete len:428 (-) Transcript_22258:527-1810(-)